MAERMLHLLLVQTLVLSTALVAVALLRRPAARLFGAEAAYRCWSLPLLATLAALLPHPALQALPAAAPAIARLAPDWLVVGVAKAASARTSPPSALLLAGWAAGALLCGAIFVQSQRRFMSLVRDGVLPAGTGPALVGVLRGRVLLPADFAQRFEPSERALMLAHEGVHQRRRDNAWNLAACALVVLHWFNPLAWLAWRRLRADQELAVDAIVLREAAAAASPAPARTYAAALLKVQQIELQPPLSTAWQSTHPLVERLRMLDRPIPSSARRRSGWFLGALLSLAAAAVAYAAQPAVGGADDSDWTLLRDGLRTRMTLQVDGLPPGRTGQRLRTTRETYPGIRFQADARTGLTDWFGVAMAAAPLGEDRVKIALTLTDEATGKTLAKPTLIARLGDEARVDVTTDGEAHRVSFVFVATSYPAAPAR